MGKSFDALFPIFTIFEGYEIFAETVALHRLRDNDHHRAGGHVLIVECGQPGQFAAADFPGSQI